MTYENSYNANSFKCLHLTVLMIQLPHAVDTLSSPNPRGPTNGPTTYRHDLSQSNEVQNPGGARRPPKQRTHGSSPPGITFKSLAWYHRLGHTRNPRPRRRFRGAGTLGRRSRVIFIPSIHSPCPSCGATSSGLAFHGHADFEASGLHVRHGRLRFSAPLSSNGRIADFGSAGMGSSPIGGTP